MAEFFLSPESKRGIERELQARERRFAQARSRVDAAVAQRIVDADRINPQASNELKQAYALTGMGESEFMQLSEREAELVDNDPGIVGRVGDVVNAAAMGWWNQAIKPALRGAFLLTESLAHGVQRPIVAAIEAGPGAQTEGMPLSERVRSLPERFAQNYEAYGDSALTNFVQRDFAPTDAEGNDLSGEGSFGHGILPAGHATARTRQERQLQVRGQGATFGRSVTNGLIGEFYAPGDRVYDITSGVAQFAGDVALDPVALGTMGATRALAASKGIAGARTLGQARRGISIRDANDAKALLDDFGLVSSKLRRTALPEQVERVFGNTRVLEDMAALDSYQIMRRMKLDRIGARGDDLAELLTKLGDETDPTKIGEILLDAARQGAIRERGFYAGHGRFVPNVKAQFRDMRLDPDSGLFNLPEFRYGGINPSRVVSAEDKMQSALDIDGLLRLGKVGEADRAAIVNRALRADGNDALIGVVGDSVRAIARKMDDLGVDEARVDELIDGWKDSINKTTSYLLDEAGRPSPPPWAKKRMQKIHGVDTEVPVPQASMIAHMNKSAIPLPDPQDIRRATTKYDSMRKVYESAGWDAGTRVARNVTRYAFKFPTLFTRIAYPLRNNLDNQARAAGAGFHSAMTNPKAWLSLGVMDPQKFRDMAIDAAGELGQGRGVYMTGGRYGVIDEISEAVVDDAGNVVEPARAVVRVHRRGANEVDEVIESTVDELHGEVLSVAKSYNEAAREFGALTQNASGMWMDEGQKALGSWRTYTNGVDKEFVSAWRTQLGHLHNDPIARRVADDRWRNRDELIDAIIGEGLVDEVAELSDSAKQFFKRTGTKPDRMQVSEYIDYIEGNIQNLTGGNTGLRRMLATGDLNGVPFNDLTQNRRINQILREQYLDDAAPAYVSGDTFVSETGKGTAWLKAKMDWWVDVMASRPENRFTRFPLLAEVFADDLSRLMPTLADDGLRAQLVQRAADAGFDDRLFPQIAQAAQDAAGQAGINSSIDDLIDAAKLHSSDRMLDIAFDATRRSSFQEMADVVFPFYDAFVEVAQSWARIVRDNPAAFSRGAAAYRSARGEGLFYANEHGEEVFAYPGGGMLAKVLGIENGSVRLEGRTEGLNLVTQGIGPGFGPMVQWAAGAFLPDTPDLQWVRDVVLPYGSSIDQASDLVQPGKLLNDLMPAWSEKALNAWSEGDVDEVAFNSAVGDALKVLSTVGGYDMSNPASKRKLMEDAEKAGRWTMFLRSALQMGAPTGPGVAWEVRSDPDGTWHRINTMASAYYDLLQNGDQQSATMAFIEMYGVEPFWITQGKTRELREGPRTQEGWNWIQRHGEAAERHADVIGYFVPAEDPLDTGDYGVYQARLASGEIESLTADQQLALANQTKARAIYYAASDRLTAAGVPTSLRNRHLRLLRDQLDVELPGWQSEIVGVSSKLDRDERIRLLEDAVNDPALADSPVTKPLRAYLEARRDAYAMVARRGTATTLGAQANADIRDWLFQVGQSIVAAEPEFQGVWQSVLSSEVDQ